MEYPKTIEEQREDTLREVVAIHYLKEVKAIQRILRIEHDVKFGYSKVLAFRDHYRNKIGFYEDQKPEGWAEITMFDDYKWKDKSPNSVKHHDCFEKLVSRRREQIAKENIVPVIHDVENMSQALCVDLSYISMDDLSNEEIRLYNQYMR